MKVLIADDCAPMRKMIRSMLDDLAGEIFEAENGQAAIEAYSLHKPDWVTLDLAMQPVDGLAAAWELKSRDPLARIIIVTNHDTEAFRQAARLAGASKYVLKDDLSKVRDLIAAPCAPPYKAAAAAWRVCARSTPATKYHHNQRGAADAAAPSCAILTSEQTSPKHSTTSLL